MSWKQCFIPYGESYEVIQETVSSASLVRGNPTDMALFVRATDDYKHDVLLLSPGASHLAASFPGEWSDIGIPTDFAWSLLFGHADAHERLGLKTPREFGQSA